MTPIRLSLCAGRAPRWCGFLLAASCPLFSHAESYFNPAFLSDDTATVADLSRFEKGNNQPPGVYRVDIWRNDDFIATQDVHFAIAKGEAATTSGGLTPCFNADWLKRLGVNLQAFPAANSVENQECINLPTLVPGATITYNFASQRLDINLPQAAMDNCARRSLSPE